MPCKYCECDHIQPYHPRKDGLGILNPRFCFNCGAKLKGDYYTMKRRKLSELRPGAGFTYAKLDLIVLEHDAGGGTLAVAKDNLFDMAFRENWDTEGAPNDWRRSYIRERLNDSFIDELEASGGKRADLLPLKLDLMALDGLKDYGVDECVVGILTLDMYRQHREIIPVPSGWSWLASPWSTPSSSGSSSTYGALYVNTSGAVGSNSTYTLYGVRPAFRFNSCIFVESDAPCCTFSECSNEELIEELFRRIKN